MRVVLIGLVLALTPTSPGLKLVAKPLPPNPLRDARTCILADDTAPSVRIFACNRLLSHHTANGPNKSAIAGVYISRGVLYLILNKCREGAADFSQAIRLKPKSDLAYFQRGRSHVCLRQYRRAVEDFSQTIRLNKKYDSAYFVRGLTYQYIFKNRHKAIADYRAAYRLQPQNEKYAAQLRELGVKP